MTQFRKQVLVAIGLVLSALSAFPGCLSHEDQAEQIAEINLEGTWVSECRESGEPGEFQRERVLFEINRFTYTQEVHAAADCSDDASDARIMSGVYVLEGDSSVVSGAKNADFSVLDTNATAEEGPQPGQIYYSILKVDGDLLYFGDDHESPNGCTSPESRPTSLGNNPLRRQ